MSFWNPYHLAGIVQGRWLGDPPDAAAVRGVGIDSRTLRPGQVYVAIRGERYDGHAFVGPAMRAGAGFAIVSDASAVGHPPANVLLVQDTVQALQRLALDYRGHLAAGGCRVIAVAGSNGKTTTRTLIHHVLTGCGLVGTQSPKSFNNHLGVPLTLLAAEPEHGFCAAEIGTNHPGEIDALARILTPDAAVITSIGAEHLEFFGDLAGVIKEEASLLPHVRPGGFIAAQADAAELLTPHYDVREGVSLFPVHTERMAGVIPEGFALPGPHNRGNAALAVAVARWLHREDADIREALRTAAAPEGRMQVLSFGAAGQGVTVIHDAYNANPDSMRHALDFLGRQPGRRVAVLADMLELGAQAEEAHREAAVCAGRTADACVYLGERFAGARPWSPDTPARIAAMLRPGDTVLLKGSRGMGLERILPAIRERFGPPPDCRS